MKICPSCGFQDNAQWRASRFDFDAEYMRFDEAENDPSLKHITQFLRNKCNFEPFVESPYTYYRRGTGGLWLYRVLSENFKVPRERANHARKKLGIKSRLPRTKKGIGKC